MAKLAVALNILPPPEQKSFESLTCKLEVTAESVAENSMNRAAKEICASASSSDTVVDTVAMFDGSWQKRGHSSLSGIVTCISPKSRKILDYHPMTKTCKGGKKMAEVDCESDDYKTWLAEHKPYM